VETNLVVTVSNAQEPLVADLAFIRMVLFLEPVQEFGIVVIGYLELIYVVFVQIGIVNRALVVIAGSPVTAHFKLSCRDSTHPIGAIRYRSANISALIANLTWSTGATKPPASIVTTVHSITGCKHTDPFLACLTTNEAGAVRWTGITILAIFRCTPSVSATEAAVRRANIALLVAVALLVTTPGDVLT